LSYIYVVQAARGASLDSQITDKGQQLSSIEDLSEVLTIQNQLSAMATFNDQKVMSSRVFDVMAAITPPGNAQQVAFSQINMLPGGEEGAAGGQLRLEGQTTSYDAMESFKKRIENTSFQYVVDGETQLIPVASNISSGDI